MTKAYVLAGLQRLAYTSRVSGGSTSSPEDYGVVTVVDGSKSRKIHQFNALTQYRMPQNNANAAYKHTTTDGIA